VAEDEPGTCIIEMPDEIVDASAATQLSNLRGVLAGSPAVGSTVNLF
jgi:flagellar assembly protein FliH